MLRSRHKYTIALLRLLETLPDNTGKARTILRLFEQKYSDQIPPEDYDSLPSGGLRWEKEVQWSRYNCVKKGLMDAPAIGIWRLTATGKRWLEDRPDQQEFDTKDEQIEAAPAIRKVRQTRKNNNLITGYSEALDNEILLIHSHIQGKNEISITSEKLCDWITFCYILGMYEEGRELFPLVSSNDVNPWYYERTKRLARLCAMKS